MNDKIIATLNFWTLKICYSTGRWESNVSLGPINLMLHWTAFDNLQNECVHGWVSGGGGPKIEVVQNVLKHILVLQFFKLDEILKIWKQKKKSPRTDGRTPWWPVKLSRSSDGATKNEINHILSFVAHKWHCSTFSNTVRVWCLIVWETEKRRKKN